MASPLRYLRLLGVYYRTSIQTDMEYRADFFSRLIASLLGLLTTAGSLAIAFQYAGTIGGWTLGQAMVLLSVYYLMDGVIEMFIAPNMREIMVQVRDGTPIHRRTRLVGDPRRFLFRVLGVGLHRSDPVAGVPIAHAGWRCRTCQTGAGMV